MLGSLSPGHRQQHQKLVAAQPGDDVLGCDRLAQPSGQHPQEIVADGVAEAVVDQLEIVDVDEQHRGRRTGAGGLCQIPLQLLGELQPVGQIGERVVVGQVGKLSLGLGQGLAGLVTIGDVGDDAFHQHPAVGKPRTGAIPHPAGAAVEPQQPVLELHRPALAEGVVEREVGSLVVGMNGVLPGLLLVGALGDRPQQALQALADELVTDVAAVLEILHLVDVHSSGRGNPTEHIDGVARPAGVRFGLS